MLRVAIVDDDTSHCRALARLLSASGMTPITFASAEEYLARGAGAGADCLVLDIQLGGMSGFDLQSRLAATKGAPPVVFLTAHEEPDTIARVAMTGCGYVRKTEPASVVLEAIRRAVGGRTPAGPAATGSASAGGPGFPKGQ